MRMGLLKKDFIRTQIISKKISTKFFTEPGTEVSMCVCFDCHHIVCTLQSLKLAFYNYMLQIAANESK